jgi:CO/xanthine dehydrogenase FAD-binding subunit
MPTLGEYLRATSVSEALDMMRSGKGRGGYIAGGTFLGMARQIPYDYLVDITGLGCDRIGKDEDLIRLGATATIQDLAASDIVQVPELKLLGQAAISVAGRQIRNMATVAGDLVSGYLLADLPVALLVLDAELATAGGDNQRLLLQDYYADRSVKRPKDWLVTEILFPAPPPESRSVFIKFARTEHDVAIADVACLVRVLQGSFVEARLALSATVNRPRRLTAVERFLEGRPAQEETCRAAAELAMKELSLLDNVRASRAYRAEVLPVVLRRALWACVGNGGENR